MSKNKVLVVGGTGYLGQHLLSGFFESDGVPYDIAFTYHSFAPGDLLRALPHFLAFQVDLKSGQGFDTIAEKFGQPDIVVNCAAVSVPRACETDPVSALSINVPTALGNWLLSFEGRNTLLIHLSTDQVYEGVTSFYKEEDETIPVNVYGKSKLAAEQYVSEKFSNFAILRSSIIFGPQTISPVPKSLPVQWIDATLSKGSEVEFFHDEFRCPVYVKDVVNVIITLIKTWISEGKQMQLLLNVGGPNRVSRVEMAETVAEIRGHKKSLIKRVSASSIDRGVKSPADISMNISKLVQILAISPVSFTDGVRLTLATETTE
ncbi:methionine adenosyltransferase 2 subunit beta [Benincasa hispida]|uniref:methionine adenosyltransferase 2 subunit beta n=1 Tax=Benincasa hispida TaxID=102211 RepID=UPI0018FF44DF|nr:methionine adenosyltransferase 2 subunit beta [Benincasa hispida]